MLGESITDKLYDSINKLVSEEVEKIAKQLYKTKKEQDLAIENAKLKNQIEEMQGQIEEMQGQIKEPYLLFVKTIWMTDNENGFYVFKNTQNKNYELRAFKKRVAGAYPLNNSFDTLEGAIKYIETIKPKD